MAHRLRRFASQRLCVKTVKIGGSCKSRKRCPATPRRPYDIGRKGPRGSDHSGSRRCQSPAKDGRSEPGGRSFCGIVFDCLVRLELAFAKFSKGPLPPAAWATNFKLNWRKRSQAVTPTHTDALGHSYVARARRRVAPFRPPRNQART